MFSSLWKEGNPRAQNQIEQKLKEGGGGKCSTIYTLWDIEFSEPIAQGAGFAPDGLLCTREYNFFQNLLVHIGDVNGSLSLPSQNKLCANLTALVTHVIHIACDDGPLPGRFVELRTRWPPGRPPFKKYALFIAEVSVVFEEGDRTITDGLL